MPEQQCCQSGALFSVVVPVRARAFWCSARSLVVVVVAASALLDKSSLGRHGRKRQQPVAGGDRAGKFRRASAGPLSDEV